MLLADAGRIGRGGGAPQVPAGLYRATLVKVVGETSTPIGPTQSFMVKPLPDRNYVLYK